MQKQAALRRVVPFKDNMANGWITAIAVLIVIVFNLSCYLINENNKLWKHLGRQTGFPLLISNKKDNVGARPSTWFTWDLLCASDLYRSPACGTLFLALYRALEICLFLFTIIYGSAEYEPAGGLFFIFFTNWTFVLFGLTGIIGTWLTAKAWIQGRRMALALPSSAQPGSIDTEPEWSKADMLYHLLLETITSASIMLTIFYWLADYVKGSAIRVDSPLKHGVSAALLLGDLALSRTPLVSYHIQAVIGYGSVYLVFLWLYFAGSGTWVYRALDWSKPSACIFYFALPLLLILGFTVMFAVAGLRELCLSGCSCCTSNNRTAVDKDSAATVSGKELIKDNATKLQLAGQTLQSAKAVDSVTHSHEL